MAEVMIIESLNRSKDCVSVSDDDSDPDDPDGTWRPKSLWEQQNPGQAMRGRRPNRGRGRGGSPQVKRFRADQAMAAREQQAAVQAIQQQIRVSYRQYRNIRLL